MVVLTTTGIYTGIREGCPLSSKRKLVRMLFISLSGLGPRTRPGFALTN